MKTTSLKPILLTIMVVGMIIPYTALISFIAEHGFNVSLIIQEAGANRMASFAWFDVIISAIALLAAAFSRQFISISQAAVVALLTVTVGVSAGLPLFLYFAVREDITA